MLKKILGYLILMLLSAGGGILAYNHFKNADAQIDTTQEKKDIARYDSKIDSIGKVRLLVVDSMKQIEKKDSVLMDSIKVSKARLEDVNIKLTVAQRNLNEAIAQSAAAKKAYEDNLRQLLDMVRHPANKQGEDLINSLKKSLK